MHPVTKSCRHFLSNQLGKRTDLTLIWDFRVKMNLKTHTTIWRIWLLITLDKQRSASISVSLESSRGQARHAPTGMIVHVMLSTWEFPSTPSYKYGWRPHFWCINSYFSGCVDAIDASCYVRNLNICMTWERENCFVHIYLIQ